MEDWKDQLNKLVYSTGGNHDLPQEEENEIDDIVPANQRLRIWLDKKSRKGKAVSLIRGFEGSDDELRSLAKALKQHCGVGGSAKDGEILIQGDQRKRIMDYLIKNGYTNTKLAGG